MADRTDWRRHWAGRERFVLFASGWQQGEIDAVIAHWQADPARARHLHVIAIAGGPLPGFARSVRAADGVTVDLLHAPLAAALAQLQARIDGVALAGDEDAATLPRALSRLLARGAVLHAARLQPGLGQALGATGWVQEATADDNASASANANANAANAANVVCPANVANAAWLRYASRKPIAPPPAPPVRSAIVIGAGLAGAAACERLCARGWHVTLVERHPAPAMEASGNLAGITMPLLSKDDNIASRLSRAAFLFARDYWRTLGGLGPGGTIEGEPCGVLHVARDSAHAGLQAAIADARALPPDYAVWLAAAAARARFGAVAPHGAWWFADGGWIRPASAIAAMLAACGARLQRRFGAGQVSLQQCDGGWHVHDGAGSVLASAAVVIVASGGGAVAQTAALPLERVRGQVTHLAVGSVPDLGHVLCREAYLTPAVGGLRSAGATYDSDLDPALRQSSQDQNLDKMRSMLADATVAADAPLAGRVGFRAVAPDRLPLVGAVPEADFTVGAERLRDLPRQPGLYTLLGYASRGLTWAPLAAELIAASLEGEPLPLEGDLCAALDPGRFLLRQRRGKPARAPKHG